MLGFINIEIGLNNNNMQFAEKIINNTFRLA